MEIARLLVEDYGVDVNEPGHGNPPLQLISAWGYLPLMEWLLKHGARINQAGNGGYTALHTVAETGDEEAYQWLVDHGADLDSH